MTEVGPEKSRVVGAYANTEAIFLQCCYRYLTGVLDYLHCEGR